MRRDETTYGTPQGPVESANHVALTAPQTGLRVYRVDTDDATYERLQVGVSGATYAIESQAAGSGSVARSVVVNVGGTDVLTAAASGVTLAGTTTATVTALKSATTVVDVGAAAAPSVGKVLTATDSTHATWQLPPSASDVTGTGASGRLAGWTGAQTLGTNAAAMLDATTGVVTLGPPATDVAMLTARASSGGTANILQWQTSANGALGHVAHDGSVVAPQYRLSDLNTAPASAVDTGTKGEIRITADAFYVCIATDSWVKAALAVWS